MNYKEKLRLATEALDSGSYDKETIEYIFPELREESEDERVRKELIEYLIKDVGLYPGENKKEHKWLRWLEKQGEQKSTDKVEPKFKVGDKIKLAREPKYPAKEIIAIQNDAYYFDEVVYLPFGRQDEWELVEQKPAWSEEDEEKIKEIKIAIYNQYGEDKAEDLYYYFLEPILYKVQPQPKQEWSEEDKKVIGNIRSIIEKYAFSQSAVDVNGELCEKEYIEADNWLKSLRPQPTWKPSDEQMKLLREVQQALLSKDCHNRFVNFMCELKKLKEE